MLKIGCFSNTGCLSICRYVWELNSSRTCFKKSLDASFEFQTYPPLNTTKESRGGYFFFLEGVILFIDSKICILRVDLIMKNTFGHKFLNAASKFASRIRRSYDYSSNECSVWSKRAILLLGWLFYNAVMMVEPWRYFSTTQRLHFSNSKRLAETYSWSGMEHHIPNMAEARPSSEYNEITRLNIQWFFRKLPRIFNTKTRCFTREARLLWYNCDQTNGLFFESQ